MLSLYYKIWVDCIQRAKLQSDYNKESWQTGTMIFMTLSMTMNFIVIMTILEKKVFHANFYKIGLSFLPSSLNNIMEYILLFTLPCVIINYLLIFKNKKYEKLLSKYRYYNGKLFLAYFLTSMLLPIILIWVEIILFK
jgi:hypothetical protein